MGILFKRELFNKLKDIKEKSGDSYGAETDSDTSYIKYDEHFVNIDQGDTFPTDQKIILGDLKYWFRSKKPTISTLGLIQIVRGSLDVRTATLKDLGNLKEVEGNCFLNGTSIKNLGKLKRVGGRLQLPLQFKYRQDELDKVEVGGKISFHKDSGRLYLSNTSNRLIKIDLLEDADCNIPEAPKGFGEKKSTSEKAEEFYLILNTAYKAGHYLDVQGQSEYLIRLVSDEIEQKGAYFTNETFWDIYDHYQDTTLEEWFRTTHYSGIIAGGDGRLTSNNGIITFGYDLRALENSELKGGNGITPEIILAMCRHKGYSEVTTENISEIMPLIQDEINAFEKKHGCKFSDVFFTGKLAYKQTSADRKFNPEYYRQFFPPRSKKKFEKIVQEDLDKKRNIYGDYAENGWHRTYHVVSSAMKYTAQKMVQNAENIFRENNGMQKYGINAPFKETNLYIFLCNRYPNERIISKAHTKWLEAQHLDIYFPKYNMAIEFQGRQHYEAIDYFGGEEGLKLNQARDERKRQLCQENDCPLLYVDETTNRNDITEWINNQILKRTIQ